MCKATQVISCVNISVRTRGYRPFLARLLFSQAREATLRSPPAVTAACCVQTLFQPGDRKCAPTGTIERACAIRRSELGTGVLQVLCATWNTPAVHMWKYLAHGFHSLRMSRMHPIGCIALHPTVRACLLERSTSSRNLRAAPPDYKLGSRTLPPRPLHFARSLPS